MNDGLDRSTASTESDVGVCIDMMEINKVLYYQGVCLLRLRLTPNKYIHSNLAFLLHFRVEILRKILLHSYWKISIVSTYQGSRRTKEKVFRFQGLVPAH